MGVIVAFVAMFSIIIFIFYGYSTKNILFRPFYKKIIVIGELIYNIFMPISVSTLFGEVYKNYFETSPAWFKGLGCIFADILIIPVLFLVEACLHMNLSKIETKKTVIFIFAMVFLLGIIVTWKLNYVFENPNNFQMPAF